MMAPVATMLAWAFLVAVVPGAAALVPGSRRPLLTPPYQACVQARPPCRTAVPMCLAVAAEDEEEASEEELKDELFELLDDVPARGFEATEDDIADVLEIIAELEETEGGEACFDFSNSPLFSGTFRLLYTSSKTFHTNEGLMAYSRDIAGVETPELLMKLQSGAGNRLVFFEEPLEFGERSIAGVLGGLTKTDVLSAECSWRATASGVFAGGSPQPSGPISLAARPALLTLAFCLPLTQLRRSASRRAGVPGCPPTGRPRASVRSPPASRCTSTTSC